MKTKKEQLEEILYTFADIMAIDDYMLNRDKVLFASNKILDLFEEEEYIAGEEIKEGDLVYKNEDCLYYKANKTKTLSELIEDRNKSNSRNVMKLNVELDIRNFVESCMQKTAEEMKKYIMADDYWENTFDKEKTALRCDEFINN